MRYPAPPASVRALLPALVSATLLLASAGSALAQSKDYFVPGQGRPAPRPAAPARPAPAHPAPPALAGTPDQAQPRPVPMPAVPNLPALPKAPSPPAAVIGVIGVSDVMRASVAGEAVQKAIGERQQKWKQDVEKERADWLQMQQAISAESSKLTPEQMRAKNRALQERIITAERKLNERKRIIDAATDFALNQIRAELIAVIRQVSEAHGINLLLHRSQVALNVNEFDITDEVAAQLNKLLPKVVIPPDGQEPPSVAPALPGAPPPPPPPVPPPAPKK